MKSWPSPSLAPFLFTTVTLTGLLLMTTRKIPRLATILTQRELLAWLLGITGWSYVTPRPFWADALAFVGLYVFSVAWGQKGVSGDSEQ